MKHIFLIGMPGAGKTYWGKKLSAHYNLPFTDLDEYIEQKEGRTIAEIFQHRGEAAFRTTEAAVLHEVIRTATMPGIIATGGGTPVYHNNMELMMQAGIIVYLRAGIDTLLGHLSHTQTTRPLLQTGDINTRLSALYEARSPVYEKAHTVFDVETLSVATFAQIISLCTGRP